MNVENIKRRTQSHRKSVLISIRITPAISEWLREKNYSPTGIFYEALKELGFEEKDD